VPARPGLPKQRGSRGFTLVEVLVAAVVLVIGLLAAFNAFSLAARVTGASRNDTLVAFLAQQKLAEIQVLARSGLQAGTTAGDFAPEHSQYTWQTTVGEPDDRNVRRVHLVISAPEMGRRREMRFSTAIF
jgi:type II secretion system protein I